MSALRTFVDAVKKKQITLPKASAEKNQVVGKPVVANAKIAVATKKSFAINPTDIIPVIKTLAGPLSCKVTINNNTEQTLRVDPQSIKELAHGEFKTRPPNTINPKQQGVKFLAVNKKVLGVSLTGVEGVVKYLLDDQKTVWSMHFNNPRAGSNTGDAGLAGPGKDRFEAPQPGPNDGDDAEYEFTLNPKGGPPPGPQPPGPQPPASQQQAFASCLITVKNDTNAVLTLSRPTAERGNFTTFPSATLKPGESTTFAFGQTPNAKGESEQGCKGNATWQVGTPVAAVWRIEWENPVGQKNQAKAALDPQTAGFQSLELVGQGDENVPISFTITGGAVQPPGPKPEPGPGPSPQPGPGPKPEPGPGPTPPTPEVEPDFEAPPKSKQPTLRVGDKSADGWVEYLQTRLNRRLQPSPNLKVDGDFGKATHQAVLAYQKQENLQVDGTVGNQTWAALRGGAAEKPSTDGRKPHTFVEKGLEARWLSEREIATFAKSSDVLTLRCVSVGDDTKIEGQPVVVFVTVPGSKRIRVNPDAKIGPAVEKTKTDQGNLHHVVIQKFTAKFPSKAKDVSVAEYHVEAFMPKELGGDAWDSKNGPIIVQ